MAWFRWGDASAHLLPGRLRVRAPGLHRNPARASHLTATLGRWRGVRQVTACAVTGNVLIYYDPAAVSLAELGRCLGLCTPPAAIGERARSAAAPGPPEPAVAPAAVPRAARHAWLTGVALAAVATKRWALGPWPLARSWRTYDLAGTITVVASYPYLRRGWNELCQSGRLNGDLLIGAVGLLATVLRENVLGLAVLFLTSLHQLLLARSLAEYQRSADCRRSDNQSAADPSDAYGPCPRHDLLLAAANRRRADGWGRRALAAALATGLLTGSPRRALAALIAAAPAAVGLAAPLPLATATVAAARRGILVRHAGAVAAAGRVDTLLVSGAPAIQATRITALQARGHHVVLLGSNSGDIPGLVVADLGLVDGRSATAAVLQAADAVITGDGRQVAEFIRLGRRAVAAAEQNRLLATGMNVTGLGLAATGTIGPLAATIWHNLTSLAVLANSLRLLPAAAATRGRAGLRTRRLDHTGSVNAFREGRGEPVARP